MKSNRSQFCTRRASASKSRRAIVLLIVLVVVVMLALSCYTFCGLMQSEYAGTKQLGRRIQTQQFVDSGAEWSRVLLAQGEDYVFEAGGSYDNADLFQGIVVKQSDNPDEVGLVSIIAPSMDDDGVQTGFRFGLTDESSRINLNILTLADEFQENGGREILMGLPDMDEYVADAILDWIDDDDDAREYGVEAPYYSGLDPPYAPKNGQPDSVEELLLVRGVTPELLFGIDSNHNGIVDQSESQDMDLVTDDSMVLGWANFLTIFSKEKNLNSAGLPRVYLNTPQLETLYDDLRSVFNDEFSTFVVAYRIHGPYTEDDEEVDEENIVTIEDLDLTSEGPFSFSQVLDLIDAQVLIPGGDEDNRLLVSPVTVATLGQYMSLIMDNLSALESPVITGRININQAPRVVLASIPGMDEEMVDTIIKVRDIELNDPGLTDEHRLYETWIYLEGIVDLTTMKTMMPFVCAGGDVYRGELVGYFQEGGGASRAEVVFDATEEIPRLLFWRDKSHLPFGYDPDVLGLSYDSQ